MTSRNSTCNVTLTCSVEKEEENVTYSWSPLGEEGNVIRIFQTPDSQELTYTCTAWNPVSNSSDSISAKQLCAGNRLCPCLLQSPRLTQRAACTGRGVSLPQAGPGPQGRAGKEARAFRDRPGVWGVLRLPQLGPLILFLMPTLNSRKSSFPWSFGPPPEGTPF